MGEATIAARSVTEHAALRLFSSWFCPYAQRSWAQLEELVDLGLTTYKWVDIDPYAAPDTKQPLSLDAKRQKYPDFVAASPRGLVPAIEHEGIVVNDSQVVCEYLSDAFPQTLLPADAKERARIRVFWEHVSSQILPFFYRLLMGKDAEARQDAHDKLLSGLRSANSLMLLSSASGYFLGDDRYSLADLALAPWWYRFPIVLGTYRGFTIPETTDYARLNNWWTHMSQRESFRRTCVSADRLVHNYREYAAGTATSEVARTLASTK